MLESAELKVNEEKIKRAIQAGLPYTITTYVLPRAMEAYIEQVLLAFLKFTGKLECKDYLSYCVKELAVNAKKANTKRIYFKEKQLDIGIQYDYDVGMSQFKKEAMGNASYYLQKQKDLGLYIKIIFIAKKDALQIEIRNNSVISQSELIRIRERLVRAQKFSSLEEAFSQVIDESEGAGLGIVIMVLMLKKMGLDKRAFDISSSEQETIARLVVPYAAARSEALSELSKTIVDGVSGLPHFPENINAIKRMIENPKTADMNEIANIISRDPAMTADLIKLVNSAAYMQIKRVDGIREAVRILGLQGVKNLLLSYGTQKLLGDNTPEKRKLWNHAYRTAYFAYNVVNNLGKNPELLDDAYLAGILHDMGKIVFSQVHPNTLDKIRSYCGGKDTPQILFEDMAAGMNHAEIGALIAEKWNFPEPLVYAIRFHHTPYDAGAHRELVFAVYLANMLVQIADKEASFDQIDTGVLASFGITKEAEVELLIKQFDSGLSREKVRSY